MPRLTRWWLHEHTNPAGQVTAVMAFADQTIEEQRPFALPCWQVGCLEHHTARPVTRGEFERATAPGPGFAGESPTVARFAYALAEQLHARGLLADPEGPDDKIVSRIVAAMAAAFPGPADLGTLPDKLADVVESGLMPSGDLKESGEGRA